LEQIERSEQLIARLLRLAKPESGDFTVFDLNELIQKHLRFFAPRLEKNGIKTVRKLADSKIEVLFNIAHIEEIFSNLIINSMDAMSEGGTLEIASRREERNAVVVVSDTGTGISAEDLKNVFDPFFTTKPTGTGLGLMIVRRIVEECEGTITISSEVGKGTRVQIELPLYASKKKAK